MNKVVIACSCIDVHSDKSFVPSFFFFLNQTIRIFIPKKKKKKNQTLRKISFDLEKTQVNEKITSGYPIF